MVPREMHVVYVLTTDGIDLFSTSTRVSAASVRVSNRKVRLTVACDRASAVAMEARGDPLPNEVDQLLVCEAPDGSGTFRNRFIKTKLRSLLDGPLLYLDGDTFVQGDLSNLFALNVDVAGAPNNSKDTFEEQMFPEDHNTLTRLGWRARSDVFVNGGVIFLNDTSGARRFANLWHTKYLESIEATGTFRDQPALNAALAKTSSFAILPHRYNAQFRFAPTPPQMRWCSTFFHRPSNIFISRRPDMTILPLACFAASPCALATLNPWYGRGPLVMRSIQRNRTPIWEKSGNAGSTL